MTGAGEYVPDITEGITGIEVLPKRAMARIWKRREKQITTVLDNVSGMYGSIEGIVGTQKALPSMGVMELDSIAED